MSQINFTCQFCKVCFKSNDLYIKHVERKTLCINRDQVLELMGNFGSNVKSIENSNVLQIKYDDLSENFDKYEKAYLKKSKELKEFKIFHEEQMKIVENDFEVNKKASNVLIEQYKHLENYHHLLLHTNCWNHSFPLFCLCSFQASVPSSPSRWFSAAATNLPDRLAFPVD